mgnify:CR=1 FL=1
MEVLNSQNTCHALLGLFILLRIRAVFFPLFLSRKLLQSLLKHLYKLFKRCFFVGAGGGSKICSKSFLDFEGCTDFKVISLNTVIIIIVSSFWKLFCPLRLYFKTSKQLWTLSIFSNFVSNFMWNQHIRIRKTFYYFRSSLFSNAR